MTLPVPAAAGCRATDGGLMLDLIGIAAIAWFGCEVAFLFPRHMIELRLYLRDSGQLRLEFSEHLGHLRR